MAEVWLAEDERLGRWVAVKVLRDVLPGEQEGELVSSFEREARVVARLQHPNIVGVYDAGTFRNRHYLVMEYVHGFSLRALLESQQRLPEQDAVRYAAQIAGALQYAHDQGVIHCDVKPENVLISEQGVPKLTDFGVAESLTRTLSPEQAREIMGTIAYLAPEVIQGAPPDPRSDVYSLALTLYEMIAGRLPWVGTNPAAVAGQRLATPAPPVRAFNRGVSAELEAVLGRALSLSQADRFQSAAEFGAALRRTGQAGAVSPAAAAATSGRIMRPRPDDALLRRRHPTQRVQRGTMMAPPAGGGISGGALIAIFLVFLIAIGAGVTAAVLINRGGEEAKPTPSPQPTAPPATATTQPTQQATATPTAQPSPSATPTQMTPSATPTKVRATATPTKRAATPEPTPTNPPTEAPTVNAPGSPAAILPLPGVNLHGPPGTGSEEAR